MKFSDDFSRVGASGWDDDEPDDRDPEADEELRSRDWPEASQPLRGGQLKWAAPSQTMGKLSWSRFLGDSEAGPEWMARATEIIFYRIWATRTLHEDWRGDYYTYEFMPTFVVTPKPKRGKKSEKRTETLGSGRGQIETLAEAQKLCEDHFRENFA